MFSRMKPIKPAATILLGRDFQGEFQVLLLKRNKALAFAGGLWVFPGGKIETEELEQADSELDAAIIAAVRETKEETDLEVNANELIFFSHWTTPEIEPKRFATYFFYASVHPHKDQVQIDDSEIKDHLWINPQQAIEKLKNGEIGMLPPTLMSLELIAHCTSSEEARERLTEVDALFIIPILVKDGPTLICLYEGDAGYESRDHTKPGPRHRLLLNMKSGAFRFEYTGVTAVPPVNGLQV